MTWKDLFSWFPFPKPKPPKKEPRPKGMSFSPGEIEAFRKKYPWYTDVVDLPSYRVENEVHKVHIVPQGYKKEGTE